MAEQKGVKFEPFLPQKLQVLGLCIRNKQKNRKYILWALKLLRDIHGSFGVQYTESTTKFPNVRYESINQFDIIITDSPFMRRSGLKEGVIIVHMHDLPPTEIDGSF